MPRKTSHAAAVWRSRCRGLPRQPRAVGMACASRVLCVCVCSARACLSAPPRPSQRGAEKMTATSSYTRFLRKHGRVLKSTALPPGPPQGGDTAASTGRNYTPQWAGAQAEERSFASQPALPPGPRAAGRCSWEFGAPSRGERAVRRLPVLQNCSPPAVKAAEPEESTSAEVLTRTARP